MSGLGSLGRGLQQFGSQLSETSDYIYKADAQRKASDSMLLLAEGTEAFKRSLLGDPDYGTPRGFTEPGATTAAETTGDFPTFMAKQYGASWQDLSTDAKQQAQKDWLSLQTPVSESESITTSSGWLAKWKKEQERVQTDVIDKIDNPLARRQVESQWRQISAEQTTAIERLQFERWSKDMDDRTMQAIDKRLQFGGAFEEIMRDVAPDLEIMTGAGIWNDTKKQQVIEAIAQTTIENGLYAQAKEALETDGIGAAMLLVADAQETYHFGGQEFSISDTARGTAKKKIGLYFEALQAQNMQTALKQFNQDRDNPSLKDLNERYEEIQKSPMFSGDEETRSTVMGWYEGLKGHLSLGPGGSDKEANEDAIRTADSFLSNYTTGITPGPQAIQGIEGLKNQGLLTGTQAGLYRDKIIKHEFPQVAPFLEQKELFAMGALGFKGKAFKDLKPQEQLRVTTLASTYAEYLSDRLFEQGGTVTPAQIAEMSTQALGVVTAKAFDEIRVGFSITKSRDAMTEAAVSKTLAAFDSSAGRAAVFQDRAGNVQFMSDEPTKMQSTSEALAQYGREQLSARGVDIVSEKYEAEGLYDVTGVKVFTGSDGMQYRMKSEGDKVSYYTRGSSSAAWQRLPDLPKPETPGAKKAAATAAATSPAATSAPAAPSVHDYDKGAWRASDTGLTGQLVSKKTGAYINFDPTTGTWKDASGKTVDPRAK